MTTISYVFLENLRSFIYLENKENKNQRFEGKRVFDARKPQDGPREERNRVNQEGGAPRRDYDDENRRGRGGRGGGRGMGRGRGGGEGGMRREGGGNRDGAPRGKREFERKSGDGRTGVKAEEKRGGGGKGNWGTMQDELKGVSFLDVLILHLFYHWTDYHSKSYICLKILSMHKELSHQSLITHLLGSEYYDSR